MTTKDRDRAEEQAQAQYESIAEMVAALNCDYDRLEDLRGERADLVSEATDDTNAVIAEARANLAKWDEANGAELKDLQAAAGDCESREDAEQRISVDALSVEVRSGWHSPGDSADSEEFCILLGTGGPACRIRGELGQHCQPSRAWIEYQDWGTPWTQYSGADQDTLLAYCQQFYFGE